MAFKPSKIKKHNIDRSQAKLNLNSMMDIFIIVLLFLLKTYSAHGQLFSHMHEVQLPRSDRSGAPEHGLELVVSPQMIYFENQSIVALAPVIANDSGVVKNGIIIPLKNALQKYADEAQRLQQTYGIKFSGALSINADRNLEYSELVKILQTCGQANFSKLHLVVVRNI